MEKITPKRFKCRCGCGAYVKPNFVRKPVPSKVPLMQGMLVDGPIIGISGYGYNNNGIFNTLRCGYRWAVKQFKK